MCTVIAVIFTFPIQLFPSMELLEAAFLFRQRKREVKTETYGRVDEEEDGIELEAPAAFRDAEETANPLHADDPSDALEDVSLDDDVEAGAAPPTNGQRAPTTGGGAATTPPRSASPADESSATKLVRNGSSSEETKDAVGDPPAAPPARATKAPMTRKRAAFRLSVVLVVYLAAVAVPDLGALIALLGALTGSILSLVAPALINRRCPREKRWWEGPADALCLLVGLAGGVAGTYQAALNVVRSGGDVDEGAA